LILVDLRSYTDFGEHTEWAKAHFFVGQTGGCPWRWEAGALRDDVG